MNEIWGRAGDPPIDHIGALLQPAIKHKIHGHMSNEHRLCREASQWVAESHLGGSAEQANWRVNASDHASEDALLCRSQSDLKRTLRQVARRLSDSPFRHHLEWCWDGDRLWVLQADRVPPTHGPGPGDCFSPIVGLATTGELTHWVSVSAEVTGSKWPKIRCLEDFVAAQLPMPSVWLLRGPKVISALATGRVANEYPQFLVDMEILCSGHIIIRTDVAGDDDYLLPKSVTTVSVDEAVAFMESTATKLASILHATVC